MNDGAKAEAWKGKHLMQIGRRVEQTSNMEISEGRAKQIN